MNLLLLLTASACWMWPGMLPGPEYVAELKPQTAAAFRDYIQRVDAAVNERVTDKKNFLWVDDSKERRARVQRGEVVTERTTGSEPTGVPGGLVHDFIGAVFIKGVTLAEVLAFVQDYDHHKDYYGPEVADARILKRDGERFLIFMRLKKRKLTVDAVLNTEHDAQFFPLDKTRWHSRSRTTRIAELEDPGTPREREKPVGNDRGFMWNLDSYWRFAERDGGVYVECQAVSLSRSLPWGFGWLIGMVVNDLPKESLTNTLTATRGGVLARHKTAPTPQPVRR